MNQIAILIMSMPGSQRKVTRETNRSYTTFRHGEYGSATAARLFPIDVARARYGHDFPIVIGVICRNISSL